MTRHIASKAMELPLTLLLREIFDRMVSEGRGELDRRRTDHRRRLTIRKDSKVTLDVIDAHHHLCLLSGASYPWLERTPRARYHGDDQPLRRDYLVTDYLADADGLTAMDARLVGSVHVENGAPDPHGRPNGSANSPKKQALPASKSSK